MSLLMMHRSLTGCRRVRSQDVATTTAFPTRKMAMVMAMSLLIRTVGLTRQVVCVGCRVISSWSLWAMSPPRPSRQTTSSTMKQPLA